ncbi:hypothetical protein RND71_009837 [Anisodus tanguticus]|uniref:Uncharacterized protein n=1 Tax=Anisodus tanguticus TaxID=243964 RepID=A0AAE1SII5_9SOLA|nr:hypothetical protein RND71_009837 [Anisodus tanguticus]
MPEWKQWHILGNGEFPKLHDLLINCSKLIGKLPENLCSLTGLIISECSVLFAFHLQGMKQIVELSITDRNYLTFIPISILPSTLKRIRISSCGKFKLEMPVSGMISSGYCNMFLENLDLYRCDSINDISHELVPRARYLSAKSCHNLTRLLIPTATEKFDIWDSKNLKILSVACKTQAMLLCHLHIYNCEKLKWLSEGIQELLPYIKTLEL